jgi:hypothetical protein
LSRAFLLVIIAVAVLRLAEAVARDASRSSSSTKALTLAVAIVTASTAVMTHPAELRELIASRSARGTNSSLGARACICDGGDRYRRYDAGAASSLGDLQGPRTRD